MWKDFSISAFWAKSKGEKRRILRENAGELEMNVAIYPKGQKSGRLCRRPVQSFHSFLLLEGVYSVSNKIPKVLGPQWEAMVQLAVVTWISLKSITSNTA